MAGTDSPPEAVSKTLSKYPRMARGCHEKGLLAAKPTAPTLALRMPKTKDPSSGDHLRAGMVSGPQGIHHRLGSQDCRVWVCVIDYL